MNSRKNELMYDLLVNGLLLVSMMLMMLYAYSFLEADYGISIGSFLIKPNSFVEAILVGGTAALVLGRYVQVKGSHLIESRKNLGPFTSDKEAIKAVGSTILTAGTVLLALSVLTLAVFVEVIISIISNGFDVEKVFDGLIIMFFSINALLIAVFNCLRLIRHIKAVTKRQ